MNELPFYRSLARNEVAHPQKHRHLCFSGRRLLLCRTIGPKADLRQFSMSALWVPTGIALSAFLVLGYRIWPAILVGAFLVSVTTVGSVTTSIGIAVGSTLEGLVGSYLVNRYANGSKAFSRPQDVFRFTVLAQVLSNGFSAKGNL